MIITHLALKNWRNFLNASIPMRNRVFIVGANASGKSNILDAIRFLRDIARSGGGLQESVRLRGGMSKIRSLASTGGNIEFSISFAENEDAPVRWKYELGISAYNHGGSIGTVPSIAFERVYNESGQKILERPNTHDKKDTKLLEYTYLEQPSANADFRNISEILNQIQYLHLVPQLLRDPNSYTTTSNKEDYYGRDFLERVSKTPIKTRDSYLTRIQKALQVAVPQFNNLEFVTDEVGKPHLKASYKHWRKHPANQLEDQFSDGTLRLVGLLWMLQSSTKAPLLLEEPELSLHGGIVSKIPEMIADIQAKRGERQIIITTHSAEILSNRGIALEEIVLLVPTATHTEVRPPANIQSAAILLQKGLTPAEIVLPYTKPQNLEQLTIWDDDNSPKRKKSTVQKRSPSAKKQSKKKPPKA